MDEGFLQAISASPNDNVARLVYALPAMGPFCYDCRPPAQGVPPRLTIDWRAGDVTIDVEAPVPTMVILNENTSAGWSATVDGTPVSIVAVNETFQGVAVPLGRHVVHWRFRSPGFFAGLVVAAVGLAGLVFAPAASRRWRGRAS